METIQEATMNNLLTCTILFMNLQSLEPLLVKNRRVFITRNHRSHIQFRITSADGEKVLFSRTFDWQQYNTCSAIHDAVNNIYQDLIAAKLMRRDSEPNS